MVFLQAIANNIHKQATDKNCMTIQIHSSFFASSLSFIICCFEGFNFCKPLRFFLANRRASLSCFFVSESMTERNLLPVEGANDWSSVDDAGASGDGDGDGMFISDSSLISFPC